MLKRLVAAGLLVGALFSTAGVRQASAECFMWCYCYGNTCYCYWYCD